VEFRDVESLASNIPPMEELGRGMGMQPESRKTAAAGDTAKSNRGAGKKEYEIDTEKMAEKIAETMNKAISELSIRITFSVDKASGRRIIKVVNSETKEVIRQIPPDEMLKLVAQVHKMMGLLLNERA